MKIQYNRILQYHLQSATVLQKQQNVNTTKTFRT